MKIKTISGNDREVSHWLSAAGTTWVAWSDIKPIIEEYQAAIENIQVGCSDYGLMGNAMLEDED